MAKLKVDVTGVERGPMEPPKPGLYRAKIKEIKVGRNKADTNDQMEVTLQIVDKGKEKGKTVRTWIQLDNPATAWKLAEFTDAIGLTKKGKKDKVSLDTDKVKGTEVQIKIDGDEYEGRYQAKVGTIMPPASSDDEDADDDDEVDDEEEDDSDDEEESDEDEDDEDPDEEDEDEEDEEDEDEDEDDEDDEEDEELDYSSMSLDDLRNECKNRGLKPTAKKNGEALKGAALKKALIKKLEKDDASDDDPFS